MVDLKQQYQCSSKAFVYNETVFYKLRQTYLIIDVEPTVDKSERSNNQSFSSIFKDYISYKMSSSELVTEDNELPAVIVSLNISETNITMNESKPKVIIMKRPSDDASINSIIFGIGLVVVILFLLLIIIKVIYKCYKMCQEDDDDHNQKDENKKSPLLPSSTNVVRRNSSLRTPTGPSRRSSLNIETQMDIRQKRLSQTLSNTPPILRNP